MNDANPAQPSAQEPYVRPDIHLEILALADEFRARKKAPTAKVWLSPRVRAALASSYALWPLFVINAVLLWLVLVWVKDASAAEYLARVCRILQLAFVALIFDIWLHPLAHPETLEGPAQGARQYQRIYLIAIFVVAGCLAL